MSEAAMDLLPEPRTVQECEVCGKDDDDDPGLRILRCSSCKNRFYCVRLTLIGQSTIPIDDSPEHDLPEGRLEKGA
jgi:hypothetical protein